MRLTRLICVLLTATAAAALAAPAGAATTSGPCIVGTKAPRCTVWRGSVPYQANDGDTLGVRLDGSSGFTRMRIGGIQAMELTDYGPLRAGQCHGVDAARRLDELLDLGGRRVRLAALNPSSASRHRVLRSAAVQIGGRWVDLGQQLISEGLALWLPYPSEWEWNATYSQLSRVSQELALQGLWRPDFCGVGPSQQVPLKLWVSSDPAGNDAFALDEEYVTVRNASTVDSIDLSGWTVRDSALNLHVLAAGTVLGPGGYVTVHVGRGTDTPTDRFMGKSHPVFGNATSDERALGDGGYLFDPQGDLRAQMVYPCRISCSDPNKGAIRLQAHPAGKEYVTLTNTSAEPVDLFGYRLYSRPDQYAFGPGTVLAPGAELRVDIKGFPEDDTPGHTHWGLTENILSNGGDRIGVQTFDQIEIACDAWGSKSCD